MEYLFYWNIVDFKVMLVSDIQQSDLHIYCIYVNIYSFHILSPYWLLENTAFFPPVQYNIYLVIYFIYQFSSVTQWCPTLCDLPGSSVHGIFQARTLEGVAVSFSRGSSWPRDRTQVSRIVGRCFTVWATRGSPF